MEYTHTHFKWYRKIIVNRQEAILFGIKIENLYFISEHTAIKRTPVIILIPCKVTRYCCTHRKHSDSTMDDSFFVNGLESREASSLFFKWIYKHVIDINLKAWWWNKIIFINHMLTFFPFLNQTKYNWVFKKKGKKKKSRGWNHLCTQQTYS